SWAASVRAARACAAAPPGGRRNKSSPDRPPRGEAGIHGFARGGGVSPDGIVGIRPSAGPALGQQVLNIGRPARKVRVRDGRPLRPCVMPRLPYGGGETAP